MAGVRKPPAQQAGGGKALATRKPIRRPRGPRSVDPRLTAIAQRAARLYELTMARALAHEEDPERFPLPSSTRSVERRLRAQIRRLPAAGRRRLAKRLLPLATAPARERREQLGDLAGLDLRSPQSLVDQVAGLPVPAGLSLSRPELDRAIGRLQRLAVPIAPAGQAVFTAMTSRARRIECVKDTREAGRDEIFLSALTIDNVGNEIQVEPIDFGKFKTGDAADFPPGQEPELVTVSLLAGAFPKTFSSIFVLSEFDRFGLLFVGLGLVVTTVALAVLPFVAPIGAMVVGLLTGLTLFNVGVAGEIFDVAESVVSFAAVDEVAFLDENGEKSDQSIPEVFNLQFGGGTYLLTTDYLLR